MTTLKQQIENAGPVCPGCGQEIDPEYCWCGDKMGNRSFIVHEGHTPVPLGCDCMRGDITPSMATASDQLMRAYGVIEQLTREAGITETNAHEHDLKAICWEQMGCTEYYVDGKLVAVLRRDLSVIAPEESDDERRT